jgi:hypothetical protein
VVISKKVIGWSPFTRSHSSSSAASAGSRISSHMHHRRQTALRLAHRRQQPPDPVQGQVDDLRVER